MSRHPTRRHGDGTAWLVAAPLNGAFLCYWYVGTNDGHLVEQARAASAADAVRWGQSRTPRVRIRTADNCTYWAGTAPKPEGFTHTWTGTEVSSAPEGS